MTAQFKTHENAQSRSSTKVDINAYRNVAHIY